MTNHSFGSFNIYLSKTYFGETTIRENNLYLETLSRRVGYIIFEKIETNQTQLLLVSLILNLTRSVCTYVENISNTVAIQLLYLIQNKKSEMIIIIVQMYPTLSWSILIMFIMMLQLSPTHKLPYQSHTDRTKWDPTHITLIYIYHMSVNVQLAARYFFNIYSVIKFNDASNIIREVTSGFGCSKQFKGLDCHYWVDIYFY